MPPGPRASVHVDIATTIVVNYKNDIGTLLKMVSNRVSREDDVIRAPDVGHLLCERRPRRVRLLKTADDRRGNDAVRGGPDDGRHR